MEVYLVQNFEWSPLIGDHKTFNFEQGEEGEDEDKASTRREALGLRALPEE